MQTSVQLYNPHQNQKRIHDSINFEPFKYYTLVIGRQFGKTMLGMNQAYYWAINNPGCKIGWVSPIYKQSEKVFDEMAKAFDSSFAKTNASKLTIEVNTSLIQLFSSERYDNMRGFTFDYLIVDEAAWQQEEAWTNVLRATVLVRGKKVLFLSTPYGKNWFYNLYNMDGVDSQYKSFRMSSYDNPLIDPQEIDAARYTLPEHIFKQEYLAEFIDNGAGVFTNLCIETPTTSTKYYAGIDLGRADDYTVLTILNENGKMVYCDRWRHNTWQNIINSMMPALNKYKPHALIELNSIGDVIYEQLKKVYDKLYPFVTTSKSKQDIVEGLQVAIQNQEFSVLDIDWLIKEFNVYTYEYNPKTRNIKYSAPNGFHDDGVMSCCIAYQCLKEWKVKGDYNYTFKAI
jgi:hypothetical protein